MEPTAAAVFAATLVTLLVIHHVADHWIQTGTQAVDKELPGRKGRLADLRHVATYTATLTLVLLAVAWRLDITYDPGRLAVGMLVTAVTHYWADRVTTLIRFAELIGKGGFVHLGDKAIAPTGTGRYALDQGWHLGWLLVTALILV